MCLAQGHNTVPLVGIEPRTSRFGVRCSTTVPPSILDLFLINVCSLCIESHLTFLLFLNVVKERLLVG